MPPPTEIKPLSQNKRRIFFGLLVVIFLLAVPLMVFYAIGYRFDLTGTSDNIKAVGGMYITSSVDNGEIYINDKLVEDMRIFRSAAYIQNLKEGIHNVYVQGDGVQTWVKELPVFPHLVTEAESFNMPVIPQIRIIAKWNDVLNQGVVFDSATSTYFAFASNTTPVFFASTSATSTYNSNVEYTYIKTLFASSSETQRLVGLQQEKLQKFSFSSATSSPEILSATSTKIWRDSKIYEKDDEVYVAWQGDDEDIPYYYCITYIGEEETTTQYGAHVYAAFAKQFPDKLNFENEELKGERLCRDTIRIDRLNHDVQWFSFFPNTSDIVLMVLDDGLYAVEVDDRAWQNAQKLYPGDNISVALDGGRIYIKDGDDYLELFTEITDA